VRCAALGVLNALLDGSKQYLMAAEDAYVQVRLLVLDSPYVQVRCSSLRLLMYNLDVLVLDSLCTS